MIPKISRLIGSNLINLILDLAVNHSKFSDLELVEQLCSITDDNAHYEEFLRRFLPTVKEECERKCKSKGIDIHIGTTIAHDACDRLRSYKSFKSDQIRLNDPRKGIHAYLMRITTRLFYNHFKAQQPKLVIEHRTYFADLLDSLPIDFDVSDAAAKRDLAILLMKSLNKKEQRVIVTDAEHKRYSKYLPDDVAEELAAELGVKKDSLRQIRKSAQKKLNDKINEINQQKN